MTNIAPHPNRTYQLESYNPNWASQFESKVAVISDVFGYQLVTIEHVGSTAIPGMTAKPQIDMVVIVKDLGHVVEYYDKMRQAGFVARGDYFGEGEEYFTEDTAEGVRLTSVHVLPEGHVWATDMVNFRDYLRAHPADVARYSHVKQKALSEHPGDYDAYYKSKVDIVQELRQKAADWKAIRG